MARGPGKPQGRAARRLQGIARADDAPGGGDGGAAKGGARLRGRRNEPARGNEKNCGNEKGRSRPRGPGPVLAIPADQSFSAGMICFLRLMMPGSTTLSPETVQGNEASAIRFTRSLGTSSVASSFRMSTTKSST